MDTRDKRSSAIQTGLPWRGFFPTPDGTIEQADRQHTCLMYAGILAAEPQISLTGSPTREAFTFNLFTAPFEFDASEAPILLTLEGVMAFNAFQSPSEFDASEAPFILRLNDD